MDPGLGQQQALPMGARSGQSSLALLGRALGRLGLKPGNQPSGGQEAALQLVVQRLLIGPAARRELTQAGIERRRRFVVAALGMQCSSPQQGQLRPPVGLSLQIGRGGQVLHRRGQPECGLRPPQLGQYLGPELGRRGLGQGPLQIADCRLRRPPG